MLSEAAHTIDCTRREWLAAGGLSGLSLAGLLPARAVRAETARARSVLFLMLCGGPSQYETFDPKPNAPAEIRGSFKPIASRVPGLHLCELLPRTAALAHRLAVVRAMSTRDPNHESAGYWVTTGRKYDGPNMRSVHPGDWPALAALVKVLKPSPRVPFSSVILPELIMANPGIVLPGQNGGFLGRACDPELFQCDPAAADFKIDGLAASQDLSSTRMQGRLGLLERLESGRGQLAAPPARTLERYRRQAADVLLSSSTRAAFDLDREAPSLRERYGRDKFGQSLLLARRLLEAGVRLVHVNWPRASGDLNSPSPLWDTHANNDARMKNVLCPQFDRGFSALLEDLDQRGLLEETVVVAIGEMGRTPRFNSAGGRDHWGNVFSFVLAGGGIRGGCVHGASDANGAEPRDGRVEPQDLAATLFHLLGVNPESMFRDRLDRPLPLTHGTPIKGVLA